MKISDILKKENIMPGLKAAGKQAVIEEMSSGLARAMGWLDDKELLQALIKRESLGSTGIGHGVAVPHARLKEADGIVVAFGRSERGVDFSSTDGQPVRIFFLVVAPEDAASAYIKVLAGISRLLKDTATRERLLAAKDAAAVHAVLAEEESRPSRGEDARVALV